MRSILISILMVVLACSYSVAAQFNIDYFNGIKWGSKIDGHSGFVLKSTGTLGEKYYSRPTDKMKLEGVIVSDFTYIVRNGRFVAAHASFVGSGDHDKIKAVCSKAYGQANQINPVMNQYILSQGSKTVRAHIQFSNNQGLVNFTYQD